MAVAGCAFSSRTGILVCGLNGTGKSTLGKALAERLHFHFIDNEDLYFPKIDPAYIYAAPRTREEVEKLLLNEIEKHEDFVFASVKGDYGETIYPFFQYAVLIDVPKDVRMKRVCMSRNIFKKRTAEENGIPHAEIKHGKGLTGHSENSIFYVSVYMLDMIPASADSRKIM